MEKYLNKIIKGDALDGLKGLPDECVDLTVTSPPYNVGKDYGEVYSDSQNASDYFCMIENVMKEIYRVTKTGGRICLNVPFIGNSYFLQKSARLQFYPLPYIKIIEKTGWIFRDFVVWIKTREPEDSNNFCGNSTQWGSWLSPSCPYLRCFAEVILVFHKKEKRLQHTGETDLIKEEFLEYTKNVWYFPAETKRDHPAPFPEELPKRCIKLYTYIGDLVLDPFMGSGTTALAALKLNRRFIGFELNPEYVKLAYKRIESYLNQSRLSEFLEVNKND